MQSCSVSSYKSREKMQNKIELHYIMQNISIMALHLFFLLRK